MALGVLFGIMKLIKLKTKQMENVLKIKCLVFENRGLIDIQQGGSLLHILPRESNAERGSLKNALKKTKKK